MIESLILTFGYPAISFIAFLMIVNKVLVTEKIHDILTTLQHPLWPWPNNTLYPRYHALNMVVKK
jgi:hypothetical protein